MIINTVLYGNFKIFYHQFAKITIMVKKLDNRMIFITLFINLFK